jgi:hypothetical protein
LGAKRSGLYTCLSRETTFGYGDHKLNGHSYVTFKGLFSIKTALQIVLLVKAKAQGVAGYAFKFKSECLRLLE